MHTIGEVRAHFDGGAETVTLTRAEWESICAVMSTYCATCKQRREAEHEAERVKRIARPVWRACARTSRHMRWAIASSPHAVSTRLVIEWEMRLRHAMAVRWQDLPPGHPGRRPRGR